VALAALWRLWRGEVARIELRHGHQIVPGAAPERDGHHAIVDVATREDLAASSRSARDPGPHQETERENTYLFQADRTIYRYVAGAHARGVAVS
jgi:hypothetical protein